MSVGLPSYFVPFGVVVVSMAAVAASYSLYVLFSVTSLFVVLFLGSVVTGSYGGTMLALERFFAREHKRPSEERQR